MRLLIISAIWIGVGFAITQLIASSLEQARTAAPSVEPYYPPDADTARAPMQVRRN
jgi:hypothetical protein